MMLNDRNDKYDDSEESEYHFTDEEVSYEVESETPKETSIAEPKESLVNRLNRSKRTLISIGVFLILVFIVYKIVSPTTSTPTTDLTPISTPTTSPVAARPVAPVINAPQSPAIATTTPAASPPALQQPGAPTPAAPAAMNPLMVQAQPQSAGQAQGTPTPSTSQPAAVTGMPPVIPMQSPTATYPTSTTTGTTVEPQMAAVAANSDKLVSQLEADYSQKMNDVAAQNKALQDQVEALSARVVSMENQMNQLVQTLTKQTQAPSASEAPSNQPIVSSPDVKVPYNVQAIIPGRAWLKADNGETITVAEGDVIKDLGRVTKIDPYDGIVEINTGNKIVTLSYGNGG